MAALLMQGERRWKERGDVMHQPACTHISDDYPDTPVRERVTAGFTAGPGPGAEPAWDPVSNPQTLQEGFCPSGAADAKSHISAGESHPGLAGPEPHGVAGQA